MMCLQLVPDRVYTGLLFEFLALDRVYDDVSSVVYVFFSLSDPAAVCIAGGAVPGVCGSQQRLDRATLKQGLVPVL